MGYKQSLTRRISRHYMHQPERKRKVLNDLAKFRSFWLKQGLIAAGTEILFVWADNKLLTIIDGKSCIHYEEYGLC
eukprot:UN16822